MKRQIKFRAWDKACKVIHFMLEQSHKLPLPQPLHTYLENTERFDIMQFTGLQDINRKDIYEGDILKIGQSLRGEVIYIDKNCNEYGDETHGAFHVVVFNRNKTIPFDSYLIENCIIIGNIYENHELLKTTENE